MVDSFLTIDHDDQGNEATGNSPLLIAKSSDINQSTIFHRKTEVSDKGI